jgi:hypothetical protein
MDKRLVCPGNRKEGQSRRIEQQYRIPSLNNRGRKIERYDSRKERYKRPSSFDRWKLFGSLVLYIDQRRSPHLTLRCFPQSKLMTVSMQRARVRADWLS